MALDETIVIERLARFEEKLDNVLTVIPDHETRLRIVEQKKEDCQQKEQISDFKGTLEDHETRITSLETTHQKDQGVQQAGATLREYALFIIAIVGWIITLYQFMGGKS